MSVINFYNCFSGEDGLQFSFLKAAGEETDQIWRGILFGRYDITQSLLC